MELQTKRHINCPTDEVLLAYKQKQLVDKEHDSVSFHLLVCDACLGYANLLSESKEDTQSSIDRQSVGDYEVTITEDLANAIERFRCRQQQVEEPPSRTWDDVRKEEGLKVGQVWRPKSADIVVPGEDKQFSVAQLDSRPHLVVITNIDAFRTGVHGREYQVIRVAPITGSVEYSATDDLLIAENDSPLGYSFIVETWNQQSMLSENLDTLLGAFELGRHAEVLNTLRNLGEADDLEESFSLEAVVMKGLYDDPIMRFRVKEYEDTSYLRIPVGSLQDANLSYEQLEEYTDEITEAKLNSRSETIAGYISDIMRNVGISEAVWSGGWKPYEGRAADSERGSQQFYNAERSLSATLTPEGKRMLLRIESNNPIWDGALVPFLWKSKVDEAKYRCVFAVLSKDAANGPSYADIKLGELDEILHRGLPNTPFMAEKLSDEMADSIRESILQAFSNHELDAWQELSEQKDLNPQIREVIKEEIRR